jgi:hypothetical protein
MPDNHIFLFHSSGLDFGSGLGKLKPTEIEANKVDAGF